ncbi:class I SAM-dependent methyltransferase [Pontibacter sp. 172403-2]|uniref:class I SAM-dependent methyltransferase n=1 Tax=Pontibacter rufus TaxID=2791028 RepID=UPI0018AFC547|nr:class I SAM-dependent methyltransferase [Pontibacter sp. 172403-2]MBF9254649.1 class I SAM-dependent methyltransferase [Pontibacter sp. 172403-2]
MICQICGNTRNNMPYEAREMMYGLRTAFNYFQCANCQCLQIEAIPADIARYYPADYNGFAPPKKKYYGGWQGSLKRKRYEAAVLQKGAFKKVLRALFPVGKYQVLARIPLHDNTRILDMGCGKGAFLYPLYQLGMKHVMGADPFIAASIVYPDGYRVQKGFIYELEGVWDVIMYNHSFEHVPDPLANLQAVERLLAPGGTCIIRIPTVSSYAWEYYGTDWFQLDAPRHFFLHSVKSMRLLAEQAGLEVTDVVYDATAYQFINSEQYRKGVPLQETPARTFSNFFRRKRDKWKYGRKARILNQQNRGDQAAFFLKRKQKAGS